VERGQTGNIENELCHPVKLRRGIVMTHGQTAKTALGVILIGVGVLFTPNAVEEIDVQYCSEIELNGELYEASCGQFLTFSDESSPLGGVDLAFALAWDMEYLYVRAQMFDSYLNAFAESDDDTACLNDDCLQIFIDPDNSRDETMQENDYRFALTVLKYLLDGSGWDNWDWDGNMVFEMYQIATINENSDVDQGGSFIELGIPWTDLGVTPENGMEMGILVGFTDRDTTDLSYPAFYGSIADPSHPNEWPKAVLIGDNTGSIFRTKQQSAGRFGRNQVIQHIHGINKGNARCAGLYKSVAPLQFTVRGIRISKRDSENMEYSPVGVIFLDNVISSVP